MTEHVKPTRALIVTTAMLAGARQISCRGLPGRNFLTNRKIGDYQIGTTKFELSEGEFMGDPLIGVTIFGDAEASCPCWNLTELADKLATFKTA